jgi:large repetitive protein
VRLLGTTTVAQDGTWSFTPTTDLKAGPHQFTAISTDGENNYGSSSEPMLATISAPPSPVLVPPPSIDVMTDFGADLNAVDSGIPSGSTIVYPRIRLNGSGVEGDIVKLYDGTSLVGSGSLSSHGTRNLDYILH